MPIQPAKLSLLIIAGVVMWGLATFAILSLPALLWSV